jgi:lipopolysaccharide export system protein LptA
MWMTRARTIVDLLRRPVLFVLLVVLLFLTSTWMIEAHAEKADRQKEITYSGDHINANIAAKGGDLSGNVVIVQGTLEIHADRVVFRQNDDDTLSATAYGNPVTFREKRDDSDTFNEGEAQRVVYDGRKRLVELFDQAMLKQPDVVIRSNYISYNAGTDTFEAEGKPDTHAPAVNNLPLGSRVRGSFQPQQKANP